MTKRAHLIGGKKAMAQDNRQSGGWTLKPLTVEVCEVAIVLGTPDGVPGGRGGA